MRGDASRSPRAVATTIFIALSSTFAGCGGPDPLAPGAADEQRLRDVGELYRVHQALNNTPPKALKDLMQEANASPSGFELIRSGDVVVRWDATLPDTKEEPGNGSAPEVLAYLKNVPEEGGLVLMLDRSIRRMTPEEFKTAPKAGKDAPSKPAK
jgi:hypothetical protein